MKAVANQVKRVIRILTGVLIVIAGLILAIPGVPGPGLLVVFAGLSVLAVDFVWAHRLKTKMKDTAVKAAHKVRGKPQPANAPTPKP